MIDKRKGLGFRHTIMFAFDPYLILPHTSYLPIFGD